MREIALEVGVQAGAIYNHCPNKQALLTNLLADHMQALLDAWNEIDLPKDPAAQLEAFVRFHIQYHLQRPDQVFISYMELRNLEPDNFKQIEVLRRKYEAVPKNILAAGANGRAVQFGRYSCRRHGHSGAAHRGHHLVS